MKQVHRTGKASKSEPEDVISSMPDNVITNILDRLPLEAAVRTDILSRNWRYRWTMLTQLIFDKRFFEYLQGRVGYWCFDVKNISRLLLHVKGPITKFDLYIPNNVVLDVEDINHWVLFLSKKGIKEFSIINMHEIPLTLPTHIFSLLELKHLKLQNCYFHPAPDDCGFPNILSLHLQRVTFGSGGCWKLISRCHLVEILIIRYPEPIEKVKLAEIATLKNLKALFFPLCYLDNIVITCSDIFELGGFLPKLEELHLDFRCCKFRRETGTRKWVSTAFPTLKNLIIYSIDFGSGSMLSCAFEMIWGSPNLKFLMIGAAYKKSVELPAFCLSEIDYHTMEQLQLQIVNSHILEVQKMKYI
uniref:F-box/FBD/LRR-repeat protein At1g13570-like n=1 Tax=Erigeron canadensis TaxID=72917 RepID=UPI001CB996D3|nr:F-box/FBD/LRR-repeat protein At1g13570-like [Erigeron canadensis]